MIHAYPLELDQDLFERFAEIYMLGFLVELEPFVMSCLWVWEITRARKKLVARLPLSSECGTYKKVTASFWPWLAGESPQNVLIVPSWLGRCKSWRHRLLLVTCSEVALTSDGDKRGAD